jgi:hypothetical protein
VIKAEQDLPITEGGSGERVREGAKGEMTQTMYAHVNKRMKKYIFENYVSDENSLDRILWTIEKLHY